MTILGATLKRCCTSTAARNTRASWLMSAVNCRPSGRPLAMGMGIEIAGVPNAVHGASIRGSPVVDRPNGAGPIAAAVSITGVDLNFSANRLRLSAMKRLVSLYCSVEIFRPLTTKLAIG